MKKTIIIWILALILLVGTVSASINDDLISAWTMDNANTNATHSLDNISSNHAILGAGIVTGVAGYENEAHEFDGTATSQETIASPANGELNPDYQTISLWAYADTPAAENSGLISKYGTAGANQQWAMLVYNGYVYFQIYTSSGVVEQCGSVPETPITAGTWTQWAFTWNGTQLTGYMNGTEACTDTGSTGAIFAGAQDVRIGEYGSAGEVFDGKIDQVYFYNRSLSGAEINEIYSSTFPFVDSSTTDLQFTVTDDFNASSISSFNISIDWVNGSTTTHTTTNGTISLINVSYQEDTTINITYSSIDYFDITQTNVAITANTSNPLSAAIYQAYACFNATEKISGYALTPDSFTIGSKTNPSCFNLTAAVHTVTANKTGWFSKSKNFNITALSNSTYTIENMSSNNLTIYVKDIRTGAYLTGFSINATSLNHTGWAGESYASTTNQSFSLINNSYTISVDHPSYALTNAEVNLTVSGNANYTFFVYPTNSLNITFYDENTNTILTTQNMSFEIILDDANATVSWTTNGTKWVDGLTSGNYEVRYRGTSGFTERNYFFTLENRTYNELSLYTTNSTGAVSITTTLYDEYGNKLEGYTIKLLRYYPAESGFLTVDMGSTNTEGATILTATLNDFYYKFRIIDTDGSTVLKTTTSSQIYETSITLYVTLGGGIGTLLDSLLTVSYDLSWLNASDRFKFTWDNSDGTVILTELYVYTVAATGNILYSTTTSTSSSGTLYAPVLRVNGTTYEAKAYVTFLGDAQATLLDTLMQAFEEGVAVFGTFGLFLTFIIIVALAFTGLWNPAAPCILLPVALVITRIAHLHALGWTWITAITAVGIIIIYLIRDKS